MKLLLTSIAACGLMAAGAANAALDDAAAQAMLKKSGCAACHKLDKASAGPSINDIAKKRKGQANAPTQLTKTVRDGSKGVYGADSEMAGFPAAKISDADLASLVQWILTK